MKRSATVRAAAALVLLAGCGGDDATEGPASDAAPPREPMTVTVLGAASLSDVFADAPYAACPGEARSRRAPGASRACRSPADAQQAHRGHVAHVPAATLVAGNHQPRAFQRVAILLDGQQHLVAREPGVDFAPGPPRPGTRPLR